MEGKSAMEANAFQLNNENIRVSYYAEGSLGAPAMTYEDPDIDKSFKGPEIRVVQTDIGELATATLEGGVDQRRKMFSLLLPAVTVAQVGQPVTIKTKAILTTFPRVVGSNLPGPNETYRVESLYGTAQYVIAQKAGEAKAKGA
jgi:hypothetical protein